ncbi:noggin-2-like [Labrus mixtus]|uniref:noggin-2-like n=1 Tax=Labrus mixtus TaxID=508554 RepID=UPI0029C0C969|nr:noggin-2-like [Labrus mixtus]
MSRLNCLWIYVSLLYGSAVFSSNISAHNQLPNVTLGQDVKDKGMDSSFLQLRVSLTSYLQPIRPYTLMTRTEDYQYLPKPRHRRLSQLLHLLGSSYDVFWMSIEQPSEGPGGQGDRNSLLRGFHLPANLPNKTTAKENFNLSDSPELREAAANQHLKLEEEATDLDLSSLSSDVARSARDWLVRSATCELSYQWVDLGPAFWPRWLRQTDCKKSDGGQSCSFPSGMECVRAKTFHIKILAWHCFDIRGDDGPRRIKADKSDGSTVIRTKRCLWRQVSYPVVTACKCSCK